ncbi:MAG: tetratricopeptide repeat protein [Oleiphilaceae bacterium]|nr:tetratricopeptide repeat protein [Oleiphilaceae bacterium]
MLKTPAGGPFARLIRTPLRCLTAMVWLMLALPLAAQTDPGALMARGIEAHEAGEADRAIALFEQAREAGLASDSLYYNLGVAYYRAGRLEEAADAFSQLLDSPRLADLARYNLGLVALADGDRRRAHERFRQVHRESGQERLSALAGRQLERLDASQPEPAAGGNWQGGLSLSGGYEDNVDLASQRRLKEGDAFAEGLAYGSGYLAGDSDAGWLLSGLVAHRQFRSRPALRQSQMGVGLARDQRLGPWALRLGAELDHARLGGESQDSRARLQGRVLRPLGPGSWRGQLEAVRIRSSDAFPEYQGEQWAAETDYRLPLGESLSAGLGYRFEFNDREDLERDGDFFSTSPLRHRLRGRLDLSLGADWRLYNRLDYRQSRFRDPERRNGETLSRRHEEQWRLRSRLERSLNRGLVLFVAAEWERNRANLNDRDYRRVEGMAGLEWRY